MIIGVFIQNEAGSNQKNYHDEKALLFRFSRAVAHAYPFPYGFIIGTTASDGDNVDCFVITNRPLRTAEIVECEPIGLMEQFENGVDDHNVLARPVGENGEVTEGIEAALTEHVMECFKDRPEKRMVVGRFLGVQDAEAHVLRRAEPAPSSWPSP